MTKLIPQALIDACAPSPKAAPPKPTARPKPAAPAKARHAPRFPEYEARRRAEAEARGRATMTVITELARNVQTESAASEQRQPYTPERAAREAAQAVMALLRENCSLNANGRWRG